jgi:DNA-binding CsgD family transcriptional regulator
LDSGRTSAAEAAELAADTGDVLTRMISLGCLALVEAQLGDEPACRAHAAESRRLCGLGGLPNFGRDALDALGLLELSLGRPERAITPLEQANRYGAAPTDLSLLGRASSMDLIEAYTQIGTPVPPTMLEQLHRLTKLQAPALAALAWRARALLADPADFDDCFARALELHARAPSTFDTARTQLCYGQRLRRAGRRRDARQHLDAALDTFQSIGARLWSQRAAAELAAAGQPVPTPNPLAANAQTPNRPAPNLRAGDTLTAQELQIARIAAAGATNREAAAQLFLSVKTIEMHLGRVYRKLGVRSRTQLANLFGAGPAT